MTQMNAPTRNNSSVPPAPADDRLQGVSMDPAQQSLADALRITFRVIQFVMIVLVALFVFSGFDTVSEGEQGISLAFGKVKQSNLPPGRQFHLPYPVGELIKVPTGQRSLRIDQKFFPELTQGQRSRSFESLAGMNATLVPGFDGSLITGDGNIAHASWTVIYRCDDARSFVENLHRDDVEAIVRAAVARGVVRTVAELDIEQFLKQFTSRDAEPAPAPGAGGDAADDAPAPTPMAPAAPGVEGTIESRVRAIAQQTLDTMNSGIRIDRVTLDERIPPLFVYNEFQSVSTAQTRASKQREDAMREQRSLLNATAGPAHVELLALIDDYERAVDLADGAQADAILARIDRIFDGEPGEDDLTISGEVTQIVNAARLYRTDVVARARSAASRFDAKLEQYRVNPEVFVATEWSDAYLFFLDMARAELFPIPPSSSTLEIILNSDPEILKRLEIERNRGEAQPTIDQRLEEVSELRRRALREQLMEERRQRQ